MNKVILVDWSQMGLGAAFAFGSDFDKGKDTSKMIHILRHSILTTILGDKNKFGRECDIVIACDGRNYWRKEIFEHYKAHRKKDREESKMDWKSVFDILATLQEEFKENFPFKIVKYDRGEADDVIAVLCKYWQENELHETAFTTEKREIIIKSNDGDFGQLHKWNNVRQWDPIRKKYLPKPESTFLVEKCMTGDAGDGIPNMFMPHDFFVNGTGRQKSITAKWKEIAFKQHHAHEPIHFGDVVADTGYHRNRNLIDFDYIPKDVSDSIIDAYLNTEVVRNKQKIFNYFVQNRCKMLMEKIQEF